MSRRLIHGATVTIHGDHSVGIPDHVFRVEHLDVDLDLYDEADVIPMVRDLRAKLREVGAIIGDMPVSVFLHGWDEYDEDEDQ